MNAHLQDFQQTQDGGSDVFHGWFHRGVSLRKVLRPWTHQGAAGDLHDGGTTRDSCSFVSWSHKLSATLTPTRSMMSSRLPKWCVLHPSARSTSSWVACFRTAGSRSSAMAPSWGMTTVSISSSWECGRVESKWLLLQNKIFNTCCTLYLLNLLSLCVCMLACVHWPHRVAGLCWERTTGCEALWFWSQFDSRSCQR